MSSKVVDQVKKDITLTELDVMFKKLYVKIEELISVFNDISIDTCDDEPESPMDPSKDHFNWSNKRKK